MTPYKNRPPGTVPCSYVEQVEMRKGLTTAGKFCEFYTPANYFYITNRPDAFIIEGWLGRPEHHPPFFEDILPGFTFFDDYIGRKSVCFTFDKIALYKLINILPEKPLKFVLRQVDDFPKLYSMLNQEEIYQLLHKKQWAAILHILYQHKTSIANDPLLHQAARAFESEFLKEVSEYPENDDHLVQQLEKLYMLNGGGFFDLQPRNLKALTLELAKRKKGTEGYNYALEFPNEEISKKIILDFEQSNPKHAIKSEKKLSPRIWVEIYNRLFELINHKENSETYFSGLRFITVVQEFDAYFPDYAQYISLRNEEGKSTSRKIFYYDILMSVSESIRVAIVERILSQLSRQEPEKVRAIRMLLGSELSQSALTIEQKAPASKNPVVFLSYSWDSSQHDAWVLNLANLLCKNGVDVILDKYDLRAGKNLTHFMEQAIARAHKVVIVFTPNYKLKADKREGGVGYEYSIMNASLYRNQTNNEKFIPILRTGSIDESIPDFMRQFIHIDLRNDDKFAVSFNDLIREIYDEPAIKKPELGSKPVF